MNVVLYARTAVDGQNGSIEGQLDRLTSFVESRENWTSTEKLVDRGRSGRSTDRPGYRRLLKLVRSGRIDVPFAPRLLAEAKKRRLD